MSWPVRSKLLGFYVATPAASTVISIGTVPTGKTWLVHSWTIYNGGALTRDFLLIMRIGSTDCIVQKAAAVPSAGVAGASGLSIVFPAGAQLCVWSSTGQPAQVCVSGAQLG